MMQLFIHLAAAALPASVLAGALAPRQSVELAVDASTRYQVIDGFGFSEAFQRAYNIYDLAEPKRSQLVDLLFNATSGAGFTIVRNGVGSSPNSTLDWMNTILPSGPSTADGEPNYVWDGIDSGQLWVSQQAVKYGVKTFYGNAWSAPGQMKTNGRDSNGGYLCGVTNQTCATGDWRQAYANYLVKYIQLWQESGVNVTHIGHLNEPDFTASYASMRSNGQQAADFIKVLHRTLEAAGLGHVEIACCEATGWNAQRTLTQGLNAAGAGDLVGVITGHTYSAEITYQQPTSAKVWQTEASDLSGSWSTAWYSNGGSGDGYTWANKIYAGLTAGSVNGYLWWVGTQDRATNNNNNEKLVLVDGGDYFVSKRLWAFAQYSRTIRPGAVRLAVTNSTNLKPTAFVNTDGSIVVNVINTGTSDVPLSLAPIVGFTAGTATAWITDNTRDMDAVDLSVDASGGVSGATVPARAMLSIVIQPADTTPPPASTTTAEVSTSAAPSSTVSTDPTPSSGCGGGRARRNRAM